MDRSWLFLSQTDLFLQYQLCHFNYVTTLFQGTEVADSLIDTLFEVIARYQNESISHDQYNAVIIIRGGDNKTRLCQLNESKIAQGICCCPIPILVGIGHEHDKTITALTRW